MDIQVKKLDEAYSVANEINNNIKNSSIKLSDDLKRIINSLSTHWRGDDATLHINNWIDQYDEYSFYFDNISGVFNYIQNYFVNLQTCRSATSENTKIGDRVSNRINFEPIARKETTAEYYYDEKVEDDYAQLTELCHEFDNFVQKVDNGLSEIYGNWLIGNGRAQIKESYDDIFMLSQNLSKQAEVLCDDLERIIGNNKTISTP